MRKVLVVAGLLLWGCSSSDEKDKAIPTETQCTEASERLGKLACVHSLDDAEAWQSVAKAQDAIDRVRSAKYMVPATGNARLLPLFINAHEFDLHYDFMVEAFAELFPSLTPKQYLDLLFDEKVREYYVGDLTEYRLPSGKTQFGFSVVSDPKAPEVVGCAEIKAVHAVLAKRVYGESLSAVPSDADQLTWIADCGLPFIDPTQTVEYEAYHRAVGYGTLRRLKRDDLAMAIENAELSYQDVVVLDEAPTDLETVVSGAVSGTRQGPLSHLSVRSASRGTPNCYLRDAYAFLAEWEGKLVRLECAQSSLLVRAATRDEAEKFWDELRPDPVTIAEPDTSYGELVNLEDVPLATAAERALALSRFGAKGKNLAWLRQNMDEAFTPVGFLIPLRHYHAFLQQTFEVDLGDGVAEHSFADALLHYHGDDAFQSDAKLRRETLLSLQEAMTDASCEESLMNAIATRLPAVFGSAETTARFRSSSNAEDGAYFNGAGLYDSYSGCLADDLDADATGPSVCDPAEDKERSVCRALRKVWASLWNPRAYDERAWYGIDQSKAEMGILVSERNEAERANMVAFTGNPVSKGDKRYLINAQIDELPVVSPEPGMWPEQVLLTIAEGKVSKIDRVSASSEVPDGEHVLSDAQLESLGEQLAKLAAIYPYDLEPPKGRELLLDTEWKVTAQGKLRIKQVRPFLK